MPKRLKTKSCNYYSIAVLVTFSMAMHMKNPSVYNFYRAAQGRTGPPGTLALARWASCSAGQVGRHVKC